MKTNIDSTYTRTLRIGMAALFLAGLLGTANPVDAQPRFGALTGIVRDAAKAPLADATVTATQLDGNTVRGTISGSGGIFAFSDLPPGTYAVVAQAPGYSDVTVGSLRVAAGLATRADVAMAAPVVASAASATSTSGSQTNGPAATPQAATAGQDNSRRLLTPRPPAQPPVLTASLKDTTVSGPDKGALGIPSPDRSAVADSQQAPAAAPYAAPTTQERAVISPPPTPAPAQTPEVDTNTPFADHDWTWLNGNTRQHDSPLDTKYFSGEFRADTFYGIDFNQPRDHSMGGSSEVFRNGEVQLEDLSIGGDFHAGNMRGRVLAVVWNVFRHHGAQRCQPRSRPMGCPRCLQIRVGGVRRVPLQRATRTQCRCRYLRFVRRPLQLSQLR